MAFLKAQWQLIVMGVVALASIGMGTLAIMASSGVEEKMREIDGLVQRVQSGQTGAQNLRTIEAKKQSIEQRKVEFDSSLNAALAQQKNNAFYEEIGPDGTVITKPREPILPDVLPEPKSSGVALSFRPRYIQEFEKLTKKLRARGAPVQADFAMAISQIENEAEGMEGNENASTRGLAPPTGPREQPKDNKEHVTLKDILRKSATARAAEAVATQVYMYVDDYAFGKHSLAEKTDTPTAIEIWQAQMSLWIQQDLATALYRCNEERAAQLQQQGLNDRLWVAYMPVKRLQWVSIEGRLGGGGGSNTNVKWAPSFTGIKNDEKRFTVPLQLRLVVEEAAIVNVLGHLCSVGFYTPISVSYSAVPPDPLLEKLYVYGDDPVVTLTIDLEGYYFRAVFEQWIPHELKQALKTPGAVMEETSRTGRGG